MQKFDLQNRLYLVSGEGENLENVPSWSNQFRIVFVCTGTGTATLDGDSFRYDAGCLFFLKPRQKFYFSTLEKNEVFALYFRHLPVTSGISPGAIDGFSNFYKHLQYIFVTMQATQAVRINGGSDQNAVENLIHLIVVEMSDIQKTSGEIIKNGVFLLISILLRNLNNPKQIKSEAVYHPEIDSILNYIKEQISQNKKVDLTDIENRFHMRTESIEKGVIAKTGLSFKKYIVKSKMDLFKNRLLKIDV